MALVRATRPEHLYKLEQNLDQLFGKKVNHEAKLDLAWDQFIIDFEADTYDDATEVVNSDDAFIWPIAHLTLHLYYMDLIAMGEDVWAFKAEHHMAMYNKQRKKVKFKTINTEVDAKRQNTVTVRLIR